MGRLTRLLCAAALLGAALPAAPALSQTAAAPADGAADAAADGATVVAARPLRARTVVARADLTIEPGDTPGAYDDPAAVVGMEVRATIYAGQPVRPADLTPPAVIERNALVAMRYRHGRLQIQAEGRAMERAGVGERVRVMNLDSRATVTAEVVGPGVVEVHP